MNRALIIGIIAAFVLLAGILVIVFVFDGDLGEELPVGPVCPCDVDLDCHNFETQEEAQACFEYCMEQGLGDVHGLDGNRDGIVCETLALS